MTKAITCTPKQLPPQMALQAAKVAIAHNPINKPAPLLSASKYLPLDVGALALVTSKYWGTKGVRLTVAFWDTPRDLADRLLTHFNAWGQFANVQFVLSSIDPQVRVTRAGQGYWSYIGTDVLMIPANEPTMSLQGFTMAMPESEFRRVVRHEVGHTLGFPHEHMRREIVARINARKAQAYFLRTQGWSAAVVNAQVLTPLDEAKLTATPHADETSIMAYQLPAEITVDGRPIVGGADFSELDKQLAGQVYPREQTPPPPIAGGDQVAIFRLDLSAKLGSVKLPIGYKVEKLALEEDEMAKASPKDFATLAEQLQTDIGKGSMDAAAAPASGLFSSIMALIAALKAGDIAGITRGVRDLLTTLLGDDQEAIQFQREQLAAAGVDWTTILQRVLKLQRLLFGV